ncbi:TetR/AcrR family transcriptional regulator [Rhodococcoides corynebacterioides]|uniref:TetR/AcrR family transcriptional regulator n=1 Tax=Rhodococcoides corynebacterioides TaxID=53972 RepID=UPI00082E08B6|nr:TetR/AcrR family transcriptional regulator [Rhodococcus corynebacterioides]MBY6364274.1 TetR/AcrR family transcriptional regulator [Rhodococcus corynebacterioides]
MTSVRKRLTPAERRTQLLAVGTRLFATRPYDDVGIDEVAELAGVSQGLMYHYFASKRDFFAEIIRQESVRMVEITAPDTALPVARQVGDGLRAYIHHVDTHEHGIRAINRGAMSADDGIQSIVTDELRVQQERILDALGTDARDDPAVRLAVRGWIAFVRATCLDWVDERSVDADTVYDICMRALDGLLGIGRPT